MLDNEAKNPTATSEKATVVEVPLTPTVIMQRTVILAGALLVLFSFVVDTPQGWVPGLIGTALSLCGRFAFGSTLRNYRALATFSTVLGLMCVSYAALVFNGLINEAMLRAGG